MATDYNPCERPVLMLYNSGGYAMPTIFFDSNGDPMSTWVFPPEIKEAILKLKKRGYWDNEL